MDVWKLYIEAISTQNSCVSPTYKWDIGEGWVFVGYLKAEEHTTVEKRLNELAAKHNTRARAVLDEETAEKFDKDLVGVVYVACRSRNDVPLGVYPTLGEARRNHIHSYVRSFDVRPPKYKL